MLVCRPNIVISRRSTFVLVCIAVLLVCPQLLADTLHHKSSVNCDVNATAAQFTRSNRNRRLQGVGRKNDASGCIASTTSFAELPYTIEVESPVLDIIWAGKHDSHLFLLTIGPGDIAGGRVWISRDNGNSFEEMTQQFSNALAEEVRDEEKDFGIVNIYVSKRNARNVFFQGAGRYNWLSGDWGKTVRSVRTPGKTTGSDHTFKFNPHHDSWALALVEREECDDPLLSYSSVCAKDLFLSMDVWEGHIWTNLTERSDGRIYAFVDFEWSEVLEKKIEDKGLEENLPTRSVLATVYESAENMKGLYMGWDKDVQFVQSKDFFATMHKKLAPCGSQFEALPGLIFLGVSNACPVDIQGKPRDITGSVDWLRGVSLYVSSDNGREFDEACVPVRLEQAGYTLLLTHDGEGAFVIVQHLRESKTGSEMKRYVSNVYASGDQAAVFTLSLSNVNVNIFTSTADFFLINGLPGAYIANQLVEDQEGIIFQGTESTATKITYNGGASWERIPAPTVFNHPDCKQCIEGQDCFLTLHGPSAWSWGSASLPTIYSHRNAPGMIIGVGTVSTAGSTNDQSKPECTWLSSDGGVTWRDVAVGAHIYEFGDFGGFILIARHSSEGPTNEVLLSTDEGHCWNSISLQQPLRVKNIRMEPDGQRPRFFIHGDACEESEYAGCALREGQSKHKTVIYTVDIQDLLNYRKCDSSDYEVWQPLDNKKSACLLGSKVKIEKRRRLSRCLNGGNYAREEFDRQPCECGEDDVMCGYGFKQMGPIGNKTCARLPYNQVHPCKVIRDGKVVQSSTGKRLVHKTECFLSAGANARLFHRTSGTVEERDAPEIGKRKHCRKGKKSFFGLWVSFLVLFGFAILITAMIVILKKRELGYSSFDEFGNSAQGFVEMLRTFFRRRETTSDSYFVPLQ